jgi:hypothetical protein
VLARFDHVASFIVNVDHSVMRAAEKLCLVNRVADSVWLTVPQPTESEYIAD